MNLITLSGISKQRNDTSVLQSISFSLRPLQKLGIAGATGSGKSTLLKIMAGLVQADAGEVLFENNRVKGPDEKLLPGHPGIAYVSQYFELRNNYRVEEELSYTNQLSEKEAQAIFKICRIEHLLQRKTDQLSGGEKQRIVLARMLILSPKLLLLDEPFSNLDMKHKVIMKRMIQDVGEQLQITPVLVSHDPLDVLSWADEIIVLKEGRLLQQGTPEFVYQHPIDEYAAGLFGKYNLLTPAQANALCVQPHKYESTKTIVARPEDFKMVDEEAGIEGIVQQVHYYGSYYEADILLQQNTVTIKTGNIKLAKGDTVFVALSPEKIQYI